MTPRQLSVIFATVKKVAAMLERDLDASNSHIIYELMLRVRVNWIYRKQGAVIAAIAIVKELSIKDVFESLDYVEDDAILAAADFRDHFDKRFPKPKPFDSFEDVVDGWLIMTPCHPSTKRSMVDFSSFRSNRREAITHFIKGSSGDWDYWKKNYGFRCVRASSTIRISASVQNLKRMGKLKEYQQESIENMPETVNVCLPIGAGKGGQQ